MTAVTRAEASNSQSVSNGSAFLESLPVYRFAMHFAAVNMGDLNYPGSPRSQAMDWWVSDDEGLTQVGQIAEFIGRFHEELMRLPESDASVRPIGAVPMLAASLGRDVSIADLTSQEEVLDLMRSSAGIREDGGAHILSDSAGDRQARARSATMMRDACDRVCAHIQQRFAPDNKSPKPAAGYRQSGRSFTPSL